MDALGMIEVNSIAAGYEASDIMLKTAEVKLICAQPVCCGKYMVMVQGGVSEVESSVRSGAETAGESLVDSFVIASLHRQIFSAIACSSEIEALNAVGVFETFSLAACILSADTAVKAAEVQLVEIRLGRGLGGKAYAVLTGDVSAVRHAVEAGTNLEGAAGMIVNSVVIPSPHTELIKAIL